jgi:hypothetical protein
MFQAGAAPEIGGIAVEGGTASAVETAALDAFHTAPGEVVAKGTGKKILEAGAVEAAKKGGTTLAEKALIGGIGVQALAAWMEEPPEDLAKARSQRIQAGYTPESAGRIAWDRDAAQAFERGLNRFRENGNPYGDRRTTGNWEVAGITTPLAEPQGQPTAGNEQQGERNA